MRRGMVVRDVPMDQLVMHAEQGEEELCSPLFARSKRAQLAPEERKRIPWYRSAVRHAETRSTLDQQGRRWRLLCFCLLIFGHIPLVIALVTVVQTARVAVVQIDSHGYAVPIKLSEDVHVDEHRQITSALWNFVNALRTLSSDDFAQKKYKDLAFAFLSDGTQAVEQVEKWLEQVRQDRAKGKRVDLQIGEIASISKNVWKVNWTESERWSGASVVTKVTRYYATMSVAISPSSLLEEAAPNPLGAFITELNVQQVQ